MGENLDYYYAFTSFSENSRMTYFSHTLLISPLRLSFYESLILFYDKSAEKYGKTEGNSWRQLFYAFFKLNYLQCTLSTKLEN